MEAGKKEKNEGSKQLVDEAKDGLSTAKIDSGIKLGASNSSAPGYNNGSAGWVNQPQFGSTSASEGFFSGRRGSSSANNFSGFISNSSKQKDQYSADAIHSGYQARTIHSNAQTNTDLENLGKYDSYTNRWTSSTSIGSNTESLNFSKTKSKSSTSADASSTITTKDVESLIVLDLNRRFNEFVIELGNNRKSMGESKRTLGAVITKVNALVAKTDSIDTSLNDAETKLTTKVSDFEKEIVTARNSLLAVIALFASFFTFISISVNIFSREMSLSTSISVLLVIWCCLISFIFVFMAGINKGGAFFTSLTFFKHAICMVLMFICAFTLPRVVFYFLPIQWFP